MSQAACFKKRACDPPVRAAVDTGDAFTDSIEAGRMNPRVAKVWLAWQIALDENYVAKSKAGFDWVIAATAALERGEDIPPVPWLLRPSPG